MPKMKSRSEGKTVTYKSKFRNIPMCSLQVLEITLHFVTETGSQISAISEFVSQILSATKFPFTWYRDIL